MEQPSNSVKCSKSLYSFRKQMKKNTFSVNWDCYNIKCKDNVIVINYCTLDIMAMLL